MVHENDPSKSGCEFGTFFATTPRSAAVALYRVNESTVTVSSTVGYSTDVSFSPITPFSTMNSCTDGSRYEIVIVWSDSRSPTGRTGATYRGKLRFAGVVAIMSPWKLVKPSPMLPHDGHTECLVALLEKGAEVNQMSPQNGASPLLVAIIAGRTDCVAVLRERGGRAQVLAAMSAALPVRAVVVVLACVALLVVARRRSEGPVQVFARWLGR